jgi:hypothetical protein
MQLTYADYFPDWTVARVTWFRRICMLCQEPDVISPGGGLVGCLVGELLVPQLLVVLSVLITLIILLDFLFIPSCIILHI